MPEVRAQEHLAPGTEREGAPFGSGVFAGSQRRQVWGSCLWLDVTGFTALTDKLTEQGPAGIESLSVALDHLYVRIGSSVSDSGGQVLFFAGDGAMCVWTAETEQELTDALFAATRTALRLRREFEAETWHERLEVRQVVVSGRLTLDVVGGEASASLEVVSGPPLVGLSELSKLCRPNQVMLSAPSARLLAQFVDVQVLTSECVLLLDLNHDGEGRARQKLGGAGRQSQPSPARQTPDVIASELRRISVAFVHWSRGGAPSWHELQALTLALQQTTRALSGFLCQLVRDEKGFTGLVVFGLPGQAQGDDSQRAVRLALDFSRRALELGVRVKSGVATGPAFCGICGGGAERQYCVLGNTVNRAARLTELADDGPLVDAATFALTQRRWTFSQQGRLHLRGFKQELDVYRPVASGHVLAGPRSLIGFERESLQVRQALFGFASAGRPPLVIKGEMGSGKSALLSRLRGWCAELSFGLCVGFADELDQYTGYFALRGVARELFAELLEAAEAGLLEAISRVGHSPDLASLLNPLFLTEHAPTALVSAMSPETRAENRERLVADLLRARLADGKLVIAIDDAHWLDASSLALLDYLAKHLPNLLCVFASRPGDTNLSRRMPYTPSVEIAALDVDALTRLVLEHTTAEAVSPALAHAVARSARGNPLHCIELARSFTTSSSVVIRGGTLGFQNAKGGELEIPGTLEDLILARFDRLSASARQALRAASVMGVSFDLRVIRLVLAELMTAEQLDLALGEIVQQRMIRVHETHEFEHASLQSVIYNLLLPSDQRALHERTARALQVVHEDRLQPVAARIAHHWLGAHNSKNAARFSAMAADLALQGYANGDASHLFRQALEQDYAWRGHLAVDLRRARWSLSMAQALYSQSRHADARAAYEQALLWTGFATPGGIPELLWGILRALTESYLRRLWRRTPVVLRGEQREQRLATIRVIHAWATLDIWEGRLPEAANKAIVAYRLAASVVDSPEAAEVISGLGYMLATTPMRRRASTHLARALELAGATNDLQARISTRVLYGMFWVLSGQTPLAERPLRAAVTLAERLGSGLWRHRAHFALGEWLLSAGQLHAAQAAFQEAANIAAAAEPPVEGFANCMAALAVMRRGELGEALRMVSGQRGLRLLETQCLVLQRFTSLGISAEIAFRNGQRTESLLLAERALELSRNRRDVDVFFAAVHGHAGTVFVLVSCLEHLRDSDASSVEGWDARSLFGKLKQALRRLIAFARMYPGARACAEHMRGRYRALKGRRRAARASWVRAGLLASRAEQPYEQVLSLQALALYEPARTELARGLAARHGMLGIGESQSELSERDR